MSDAPVLFEVSADGVARVTLNRPDKMNSFNAAMHEALMAALDRVDADPAVRVLVLAGAGRGFCAGQDLADDAVRCAHQHPTTPRNAHPPPIAANPFSVAHCGVHETARRFRRCRPCEPRSPCCCP